MSENFVSKDLFQNSMKNVYSKLDQISHLQEKFDEKTDKMIENQQSLSEKMISLTLNDTFHVDKIAKLENDITDLKSQNISMSKIIDQFQSDKKWIAMIFGTGWTLTLTIVHLYMKYKLG